MTTQTPQPTETNQLVDSTVEIKKSKVDWVAARNFYVSNPTVSLEQVAEQFDVPIQTVKWHSSKENWTELRLDLDQKVSSAIEGEVIQQAIDRNEVHATGAKNLQGLIQKKMDIAYRKLADLEKKQEEGVALSPYEKGIISDKGLADLTAAYVAAVNLERVTAGMPTSVERKEITGSGGTELFASGDKTQFIAFMAGLASGITGGATAPGVVENSSNDTSTS